MMCRNAHAVLTALASAGVAAGCGPTAAPRTTASTPLTGGPPAKTGYVAKRPAPNTMRTTRLLAGPVALRIANGPKPTRTDGTPQLRYAIVVRLNRNPYRLNNPPQAPESGAHPGFRGGEFAVRTSAASRASSR